MKKWTIEDSKELYNIGGWGTSYFGINEKGNVYVSPCKDDAQIDLREVMDELALRDVSSRISSTVVSRRRPAAFRKPRRSTDTKARTSSSTPSRSTRCSPWWRK